MSGRPEEGPDLATRMAVVKEAAVLIGVERRFRGPRRRAGGLSFGHFSTSLKGSRLAARRND